MLIFVNFFSKARIDNKETKIYGYMLISSLIDIIIVIVVLLLTYFNFNPTTGKIVTILNKIDFIHYIIWPMFLTLYNYNITYTEPEKYEKFKRILIIISVISIIIEFLLPITIIAENETMGVTGPATYFVYSVALFYLIINIVIIFKNVKKLKIGNFCHFYFYLYL